MEFNRQNAELALKEASKSNPGAWTDHSRYVAEACKHIALHCGHLSANQAYLYGLLHDIGRYAGVTSERHLIDGYRFCMERGWEKAAQICISHAFMIQDMDTSIGEFDVSEPDYLFIKEFLQTRSMTITTGWCSYAILWLCPPASAFWKNDLWT